VDRHVYRRTYVSELELWNPTKRVGYEKGHVLIYLSHILPGQITCYCPRKMLLPWGQITRRKLCFYSRSQITSSFYVSNWKSSYDIDNEMARNIARVKLKTIISLWNYRFYLNRSFNILQDVYTHNGGVHVYRILIFIKYSQNDR
jgi:hypothetical protein